MGKKTQKEEMLELYESEWTLTDTEVQHIHLGFWNPSIPIHDLAAAHKNYLEELTRDLGINEKSVVLDVGCGNGATAIWLAQKYKCKVYAIDIVTSHITRAQDAIAKFALEDVVFPSVMDAMNLNFPARMFSHVLSIESICHMDQRERVFRSIQRVLQPGGNFAFSDFLFSPKCTWLTKVLSGLVLGTSYTGSKNEYLETLRSCRLSLVKEESVSKSTFAPFFAWSEQEEHSHLIKNFEHQFGKLSRLLFRSVFGLVRRSVRKEQWGLHFWVVRS